MSTDVAFLEPAPPDYDTSLFAFQTLPDHVLYIDAVPRSAGSGLEFEVLGSAGIRSEARRRFGIGPYVGMSSTGGTFYAVIGRADPASPDFDFDAGLFQVPSDDNDPGNDQCTTADDVGGLGVGETVIRSSLGFSSPQDQDWFRVQIDDPGSLLTVRSMQSTAGFYIDPPVDADTLVQVFGPDCTTLVASSNDAGTFDSVTTPPLDVAGAYHVRVAPSQRGSDNALYGLELELEGGFASIPEVEPNDTPVQADANPVTAPYFLYAAIAPAFDVDVLAVDVPPPGATLVATMRSGNVNECRQAGGDPADSFMRLIGPDRVTVLAENEDQCASCPVLDFCSGVAVEVGAGVHYIEVASSPTYAPDDTFDYRLEVSLEPLP
jgi:hypothetical protein